MFSHDDTNTNEDRFLDLGLDLNESSGLAEWGLMLSLPKVPYFASPASG